MQQPLETELRNHFGHTAFRPGQKETVEILMAGRPALAILPTGGGKSVCYQLPAVLFDGLTLVVSPLIALMKDQVDVLKQRGIAAERLDSTLSSQEVLAIYDRMKSGSLKLLYVAPERLVNETFVHRLARTKVAMMAVDEAHCISEWGHNFRPEYLRLAKVANMLRVTRILALTATATPEVAREIARAFSIDSKDVVQTSFHRRNLAIHISPVSRANRDRHLIQSLSAKGRVPAIVYVTLQRTAEQVAADLVKSQFRARAYHAGMADEARAEVQEAFMNGDVDIIVATIAFGMGIDKADIRTVIHYNLPKTLENYQQEIGRAGRDGKPSHCELLACGDDLIVLQNFIHGDTPEMSGLRLVVDHLLRQGREFEISRYELSRSSDVRQLVLETIITYLEQDNLLEPLGAIYTTYQVSFHHSEDRILAGYSGERQRFLKNLFATGRKGRKWLTLDVAAAAEELDQPRDRILKALGHLADAGDIELKPAGVRHRFRLLDGAANRRPPEIISWLGDVFSKREARDLDRLKEVTRLAEHPGCTTRALMHYFGESLAQDCGHCGNCINSATRHWHPANDPKNSKTGHPSSKPSTPSKPLPCTAAPGLSVEDLQVIDDLVKERHAALQSPRQLARFLCGISSPATSRDRLGRHSAFGQFAEVPFATVLAACTR